MWAPWFSVFYRDSTIRISHYGVIIYVGIGKTHPTIGLKPNPIPKPIFLDLLDFRLAAMRMAMLGMVGFYEVPWFDDNFLWLIR